MSWRPPVDTSSFHDKFRKLKVIKWALSAQRKPGLTVAIKHLLRLPGHKGRGLRWQQLKWKTEAKPWSRVRRRARGAWVTPVASKHLLCAHARHRNRQKQPFPTTMGKTSKWAGHYSTNGDSNRGKPRAPWIQRRKTLKTKMSTSVSSKVLRYTLFATIA